MRTTTKFAVAMIVLLTAIGTLASQLFHVRLVETQIGRYTTNAGELMRDAAVGQTFVAQKDNLSGIAVMFATYSNRNNTQPVELHLQGGVGGGEDIRSASVNAQELRDNQFHRFEFEPIPDSKGKTFFFFLVSPNSTPGNAVTVDLNTQDPYFLGTAFLNQSGKPTIDVVFETYHTVTAREAAWTKAQGAVRALIGTWPEKKNVYSLWAQLALAPLLFLVSVVLIRRRAWSAVVWLPLLLTAGFILRLWYAAHLPITNDEGNYLYDAWTLLSGKLAGGDGYVKAPLVIAWISVWEFIAGHTVLAGRLSSVTIGSLTLFPVYFLARDLFDRKTGLAAAAAWAFLGSAIVFDIYVHTQPVALFFGISGLAGLMAALQSKRGDWLFLFAGVLLGLGAASRKSILALGLVPIVMILAHGRGFRPRLRQFIMMGLGFAIVIAAFLGLAWAMYGLPGVWEAIGVNSAGDGITVAQEDAELIRAYSIRGMTPFFRESLALIWLAAIGLGISGERAIRAVFGYLKHRPGRDVMRLIDQILPKIGWLPALLCFLWSWSFFNNYEGEVFHILGIPMLWGIMGIGLLVIAFMPRQQEDALHLPEQADVVPKSTQPNPNVQIPPLRQGFAGQAMTKDFLPKLAAWLVGPMWIFGLVIFYTNWIKFHANYIAEFIPPLILLAAPGVLHLFDRLRAPLFLSSDYPPIAVLRKLLVAGVVAVMFWALFTGSYITFIFEHTGTFDQGAAKSAADWAKQYIPPDEAIFTGAAVVPYVSGHHISLNIAHPRWYAYEFTRKDIPRITTFLPPAEEMVQAFRDVKWFLHDQQTQFSFLQEYDEIIQGLARDFVPVKQIENGGNPLTFYQRVR